VPANGVHNVPYPLGDGKAITPKCMAFFMVGYPNREKAEDLAAFAPLRFIFKIKLKLDTFPKNYPTSGSQGDKRSLWEHMGGTANTHFIPTKISNSRNGVKSFKLTKSK